MNIQTIPDLLTEHNLQTFAREPGVDREADHLDMKVDELGPGSLDLTLLLCELEDLYLSRAVPGRIAEALIEQRRLASESAMLRGAPVEAYAHWAVHAGGLSILGAVERGLALAPGALAISRKALSDLGNVSSVTVMAVMQQIMATAAAGSSGLAIAFSPGRTAESMRFRIAAPSNAATSTSRAPW